MDVRTLVTASYFSHFSPFLFPTLREDLMSTAQILVLSFISGDKFLGHVILLQVDSSNPENESQVLVQREQLLSLFIML